ncbi:MAG: 5-formyltetrahydrofolate cyclo-ligase [Alphaproteobacteria bacterium]|nr:5-formyltetrahydrofolate cyclo-ligase [Alphaproteobacteria bacterium]MCB9698972.1 5-formyltetrahydrofolate cyclo-ligase [Alphaproteobacteria bacterium]
MKALRRALEPERLTSAGDRVAERLLADPELARPRRILVYLSVRNELPTSTLVRALRERGHRVAVPQVLGQGRMEARELEEPLVRGVLGIPTSDGPVLAGVELAIVPGLAFDASGGRLGFGAGHYDRWLAEHAPLAIGVGVDDQLLPWVPVEAHDRPMDRVVTPSADVPVRPPIRVTAGAWVRDGRVYAVRRGAGKARAGLWELPGGKVEPGEDDHTSLVRELFEELGIRARVTGPLGRAIHAYDDVTVQLEGLLVHSGDTPRLTEHDDARWLSAAELDDVGWAPADIPLIAALKGHLSQADRS